MEIYSLLRESKSSHLFGWEFGISNDREVYRNIGHSSCLHTLLAPILNYYYLPTALDTSVSEVIVKQLSKLKLEEAQLRLSNTEANSDGKSDKKIRDCLTQGIPADHWVSGMLSHFVNCANTNLFHFDLWPDV